MSVAFARCAVVLLVALLGVPGVLYAEEPTAGTLVRDLGKIPVSTWRVVQSYASTEKATTEGPGETERPAEESGLSVDFTYGLTFQRVPGTPAGALAAVVQVRRLQIRATGKEAMAFDSEGDPAAQAPTLTRQFGRLAGRSAQVNVDAFGAGEGFRGLDEAFDAPPGGDAPGEKVVAMNRRNFGDARFDRILCRGLPLLFGAEAGRAQGKTRVLTAGMEFEVTLEVPGIGGKPTATAHRCRVTSVKDGLAVVTASWHVNGFDPEVRDDGSMTMRGGDMKGQIEATFRLEGGLAVRWREEITRVDQVSNGRTQRTWHRHSVEDLSIEPETGKATSAEAGK